MKRWSLHCSKGKGGEGNRQTVENYNSFGGNKGPMEYQMRTCVRKSYQEGYNSEVKT